ncbi:hypothetical protein [Streptomyces marispadix]|nr:hypothetical protein [Streptomyces marispadix]
MEVSDVLKDAWAAVEAADLPGEIQPVAFREAVRLLSPASSATTSAMLTSGHSTDSAPGTVEPEGSAAHAPIAEREIYDRVVEHTGVDRAKLEHLVHMDDDGPHMSVPGLKLGKSNAERARAVAQIIIMVRSFGIGENETPLEVIRAECERLKVYDSANFSSQVRALNGYVVTGSGQNRRVRAKSAAVQSFSGFVDSLLTD